MKNKSIIRQAAIDLYGLDYRNVVKVAGVVKTIVNWLKGFGDPEFQEQLKELERISPEIKSTIDTLSVEIGKLQKSISNTDPEQFGQALEAVRPLVSELSVDLSSLDEAAAKAKAEAPVDAIVNSDGEVISGEDIRRLDRGWKRNQKLLDSLQSLLPESLDVPIQSHINRPLMDFEWFKQFGPENIRFSKNSEQWVVDEIAKLIFDSADLDSQSQNNLINFLNRNKEFIVYNLKNKILGGTLRSYTFPSEGQPNKMTVVVDAGTMKIPGLDFEVQFPTIFLHDRFASISPIKELDIASIKNVRAYSPYQEKKMDLDEGTLYSVLEKHDWNIAGAAREFGMTDSSLRRRMQELGVTRPQPLVDVPIEEPVMTETPEPVEEEVIEKPIEEQESRASRIEKMKKIANVGIMNNGHFDSVVSVKGLDKKSPEFISELIAIGNRLNIDPSFLASVMLSESGFDHTAVNPHGGATGLIQFMPHTSKQLGTTTEELAGMTDVQQLAYVEKFFRPWAGRIKTPGDLYMATFLPVFVGKPINYIIGQKDNHNKIAGNLTYNKVWEYNKGFDTDNDGIITVGDVTGRANKYYNAGKARGLLTPDSVNQTNPIAQGRGATMPEQSIPQKPMQSEVLGPQDAQQLFNFLFAAGPIEKIVKRALCKKVLPTTRLLITIGSSEIPFHTRVRFAKILSSALRIELDAESSIHNYGEKIEIESDISGSRENVVMAARGLCEGISEAFQLATEKCGEYKISTRVFSNIKSSYALIDSGTMETCFRKFAFDMVGK